VERRGDAHRRHLRLLRRQTGDQLAVERELGPSAPLERDLACAQHYWSTLSGAPCGSIAVLMTRAPAALGLPTAR
jgi:hypothetical protein